MKNLILIITLFTAINTNLFSAETTTNKSQLVGKWKYSTESSINDFQKITNRVAKDDYVAEYFIFESNNKFRHEFIDENGEIVKLLKGKWKLINNKIKIDYTTFKYSLSLDYFFLDHDLVLGQNFNHVIFSKYDEIDFMDNNLVYLK